MTGKREVRRIFRDRKLTEAEAEHYRRLREEVERDIPPKSKIPQPRPNPDSPAVQGDVWAIHDIILALKTERVRQNRTLQDIQDVTGIAQAVLSRLESGKNLNPTFATLSRYAWALGKTLSITLGNPRVGTGKEATQNTLRENRETE